MQLCYETMTMGHYDAVYALWHQTQGVGLGSSDERAGIERYLLRNPGLSFICLDQGKIVGAILCGHDGRRGFINHLAVASTHRKLGIGRTLVEKSFAGLRAEGLEKCNIVVFHTNADGQRFWKHMGFEERRDLLSMGYYLFVSK
jgi:ribosomal protein S18 acetylase RimI-like enzyme